METPGGGSGSLLLEVSVAPWHSPLLGARWLSLLFDSIHPMLQRGLGLGFRPLQPRDSLFTPTPP